MAQLLVGGYTADMDGAGSGIGMLQAGDSDSSSAYGPLGFAGTVVDAASPSWVTRHPSLDVVYASLEGRGAVQAFRQVSETRFQPLGGPVATGDLACHVAVAPDAGYLLVSCWGDGRLVRVALGSDGALGTSSALPATVDPWADGAGGLGVGGLGAGDFGGGLGNDATESGIPLGSDPAGSLLTPAGLGDALAAAARAAAAGDAGAAPDAREGGASPDTADTARHSRAHQARFLPSGWLATTDMGFDVVRLWRADAAGPVLRDSITLPRGSGPRHTVWHPSGHLYVVTELSREVFVLAPGASGHWGIVGSASLGAGILPDDTAAEIALSRDAEFVYAGLRGSNTLAVLRVRGDGAQLDATALVDTGVAGPRHHLVLRDTLLVAGQVSNDVVSLTLDPRTGVPGRVQHRTEVPSPSCLVPF